MLVFDPARLQATFERNGLLIEVVERHGTKRNDIHVFIVAKNPN